MRPSFHSALIFPLLVASAAFAQERPPIAPSALSGYPEAWSSHDVERIAAYFTDDAIYEGVALGEIQHGKSGIKAFAQGTFADIPGFALEQRALHGGDGWAAMEWVMTGTDRETGKRIHVRGVSVMELEGGKIRRNSDYRNVSDPQRNVAATSPGRASISSPVRAAGRELPAVAIIGTGDVGTSLGPRLAAHGYRVTYGSRDPGRAAVRELVERTGPNASAATQQQAAAGADVIVLAVPGRVLEQVVRDLGDVAGKILVDVTSPAMRPAADGYPELVPGPGSSERVQALVPQAHVVKAGIPSAYLIDGPQALGLAPTVTIASDDRAAKETVARMIDALGLDPFDAGPLRFARTIDEVGLLFILPLQQGRAQGIELKFLRSSYWPCFWDVAAQFGPTPDHDDLAEFPQREAPRPCREWRNP
jgi:8-hydroxy-5-deazaflavin:NADPH oxidoreductase